MRRGIIRTVNDTPAQPDEWHAGPPDGEPLACHHGTPGGGLPSDLRVQASARPHLFDDHGHLSVVVGAYGEILDELLAAGG